LRLARLKRRKLSHNDPVDRDLSATVSTNVGEEMQRGALLLAAGARCLRRLRQLPYP